MTSPKGASAKSGLELSEADPRLQIVVPGTYPIDGTNKKADAIISFSASVIRYRILTSSTTYIDKLAYWDV